MSDRWHVERDGGDTWVRIVGDDLGDKRGREIIADDVRIEHAERIVKCVNTARDPAAVERLIEAARKGVEEKPGPTEEWVRMSKKNWYELLAALLAALQAPEPPSPSSDPLGAITPQGATGAALEAQLRGSVGDET